jgi:hypothetical protein
VDPRGRPAGGGGSGAGGFARTGSWHGSDRVESETLSKAQRWQACLKLDGRSIAEGGMEALPVVDLLDEARNGPAPR